MTDVPGSLVWGDVESHVFVKEVQRNVLDYRHYPSDSVAWRTRFGGGRQLDSYPSHPRHHRNRVAFPVRSTQQVDVVGCAHHQMEGAERQAAFGPSMIA